MTPQIKQRIEQIRRGEVPEGYKKTKVGIVPADWQEHKLSHYLTVNNDKNTDLKYTKDDVFSISGELGIVNQIELLGRSYAGVSVAPYGIVYPNDVVYTKSPLKANPYGIIKTNKLGVTGIVSTLYAIFHCNNNVSPDYVQLYFESDHNLNNYLYPIVNIGAKHDMKISDEGSLRGTVVFPPLPEQEKIAAILQTEDKVIELQQKKIDELKRLKKVYLSKMFPKKGCNVPEIRFPGFTDPWEQRKLGELGTITTGNTPSTSIPDYYSDDGIVWVTPTDICENITFESARKLSDLGQQVGRVVPKNTILVTCIASIGKNTMLGNTGSFNQQINGLTPNENKYDPYFLLTESALWSAKMKGSAASGTMQIVNRTEFSELKTWLPSLIEQQAIGAFFKQLDNLITLHQRKLEEEQKKKKALMQFLLTGIVRVKYDT